MQSIPYQVVLKSIVLHSCIHIDVDLYNLALKKGTISTPTKLQDFINDDSTLAL